MSKRNSTSEERLKNICEVYNKYGEVKAAELLVRSFVASYFGSNSAKGELFKLHSSLLKYKILHQTLVVYHIWLSPEYFRQRN